jgi:hypothetical protein
MANKRIRVAPAATTNWATLPGNTGDFTEDATMLDDTLFGHEYKSEQPDLISWKVTSNALYKGYAGYQTVIKQTGAATLMTAEPMTVMAGSPLSYEITDATKQLLDVTSIFIVYDNAVDHTTDVETIDYMFGVVNFKSSYTPVGPITITGKYLASSQICAMNKYTLQQQCTMVDNTDLCIAQSNGGYKQYVPGIKTVMLDLNGFYRASSNFHAILAARQTVMIEINPDGLGLSRARGFFIPKMHKEMGKVGGIEDESIQFALHVPDNALLYDPFGWRHATGTTMNAGIRTLLDAWQFSKGVEVRYEELPPIGKQGSAVVTDISLSGGLGALNDFTVHLEGSGGITIS